MQQFVPPKLKPNNFPDWPRFEVYGLKRQTEGGGCGGWRCFRTRWDPFRQEDGRGVALETDVEAARVNLGCIGHGEDGLEADALATYNRNGGV